MQQFLPWLLLWASALPHLRPSPSTHTTVPSTETIGVNGSYSGTGTASDVYSVKIEWGEMSFTYKTTGDKTWDPETHTYNVADDDGWEAVGNEVKVTNHSNVPVNVAFAFTKDEIPYKGEYTGHEHSNQEA